MIWVGTLLYVYDSCLTNRFHKRSRHKYTNERYSKDEKEPYLSPNDSNMAPLNYDYNKFVLILNGR